MNQLARLDTVDDDATLTEIIYKSLFDSPVLVTGALLFTNGICSLVGPFQFNVSIEDATTRKGFNLSVLPIFGQTTTFQ